MYLSCWCDCLFAQVDGWYFWRSPVLHKTRKGPFWAAEQREAFKVLHPELADKSKHQELRMAMMRHYQTVVTPDERAAFEARARQIMIDKGQAPLAGMDAVMGDAGETEPAGKAEGEGEPLGRCSII